ncbi:hypothetical protein QVA73_06370 [Staphylococcus chromogenes]|uniref:hypothetical protein n=1 Tax=Staphylococcus chromogenes TaxID=46126 RepID=UPI002901C092|nr:hypothetical protein [Staphylococcus chromogenes]MDU0476516.1 hypothetical protein [Staphylococcus chromogenes]
MIKRFKYVSDKQMFKLADQYEKGGTSNLIYVHEFDNGTVETLEVFMADSHTECFESVDEIYEFFAESEPFVKDVLEGRQATLF